MTHALEGAFLPRLGAAVLRIGARTHALSIEDAERISIELQLAALQARVAQRKAAVRERLARARSTAMENETNGH